jgi:hypothetical protein
MRKPQSEQEKDADRKGKHKRQEADRGSRDTGEPGGSDPGAHPYDRETHPAGGGALDDRDPIPEDADDD